MVLPICNVGQPAEYYRNRLGAFGVSGDLGLRPVACLSGGQKSRVAFTQMCMSK
jgi:ATP-binding cassette subfamily F protein 3